MSSAQSNALPPEERPVSTVQATSETLVPTPSLNRIDALDILRGFALMGILLMNIEWFSRPISEFGSFSTEMSRLDHAVSWLIRCFVEGKFYKLFALLFGMGFAVMLTRALAAGRPFAAWFSRRMLVLFVLGMLHMIFLWEGDILHDYAFAGFCMLALVSLFRTKRFEKYNNPRSFLKIALWWLCMPLLLAAVAGIGFSSGIDRQGLTEMWQENLHIRTLVQELEQETKKHRTSQPQSRKGLLRVLNLR